jgi:type II secretory pathway pseudopilin PulG
MKAYSLTEVMVVTTMTGVLAAVAVPNITATIKRSDGTRAIAEVSGAIMRARDIARSRGKCARMDLDDLGGRYRFETSTTPCAGFSGPDETVETTVLHPAITSLTMTTESGEGVAGTPVDELHFDIFGSLTEPFASVTIDAVVEGLPETKLTVYPIAGAAVVVDAPTATAESAPPPDPAPGEAPSSPDVLFADTPASPDPPPVAPTGEPGGPPAEDDGAVVGAAGGVGGD